MTKNTVQVAQPAQISPADLTALLQQTGMLTTQSEGFHRMRLDGGMLVTIGQNGEVEEMFPPKVNKGVPLPSLTVQIVEPPVYYNAFWLGPEVDDQGRATGGTDPNRIGRPDLNKTFSKKYDDPAEQAKDKNPANEVYDQLVAVTGNRGAFKADIKLRIVPESGELTGDEPVYTLSLSSTAALDFRGTQRDPMGGIVQEKNFIVQLAEFALAKVIEEGGDENAQKQAVLNAMIAFRLGGVIADVYLYRTSNSDNSRTWTVPAFKPVHIEFPEGAPTALASGPEATGDDIPF